MIDSDSDGTIEVMGTIAILGYQQLSMQQSGRTWAVVIGVRPKEASSAER